MKKLEKHSLEFIHFSDVNVTDPESWKGKNILSFDIDWAIDEVIDHTIQIIVKSDIKCTLFITHESPLLDNLKGHENIELAIHPNFNKFFTKEKNEIYSSPEDVLNQLKNYLPNVNISRSHSLTNSARWLSIYKRLNIKYLSNYVMFCQSDIQPFMHINGVVELPIFFADDGYLTILENNLLSKKYMMDKILSRSNGLKVFDFHPIHVALNTTSLQHYESTRDIHRSYNEIMDNRLKHEKEGIEDILKMIIENNEYRD